MAIFSGSGCAVLHYVGMLTEPSKKVDAEYKPPADRKVLVFVDDIRMPVSYEQIKTDLTDRLNVQLLENKIAGKVIPSEMLQNYIAMTPKFNQLSVAEVGKELGADLVLYVEITRFSLRDSDQTPIWQGRLATSVRWVDVKTAKRLWPSDRIDGYDVPLMELPTEENVSAAYGAEIAKQLAEGMSAQIAWFFYDHEGKTPYAQGGAKPVSNDEAKKNMQP